MLHFTVWQIRARVYACVRGARGGIKLHHPSYICTSPPHSPPLHMGCLIYLHLASTLASPTHGFANLHGTTVQMRRAGNRF